MSACLQMATARAAPVRAPATLHEPVLVTFNSLQVIGKGAQGVVMPGISTRHSHDICSSGTFGNIPTAAVKLAHKSEWGTNPAQLREVQMSSLVTCSTLMIQGICEVMLQTQPATHTTITYRLGVPLDKFIPATNTQCRDICAQVIRFLPSLRDAGVSHNDIKLANIIVVDGYATLSDFGSAHFDTLDAAPFPPNSCGYRPPEVNMLSVLIEDYSRRSGVPLPQKHAAPYLAADAWAIAVVVLTLLHGATLYAPPLSPDTDSLRQLTPHLRAPYKLGAAIIDSWALYMRDAYPQLEREIIAQAAGVIGHAPADAIAFDPFISANADPLEQVAEGLLTYNPYIRSNLANAINTLDTYNVINI